MAMASFTIQGVNGAGRISLRFSIHGTIAISCSLEGGRSSLSSLQSFTQCKMLFPGICSSSETLQRKFISRGHNERSAWCCQHSEPNDKSLEVMRKFSEQYARRSVTYFCVDKGVTSVVIKGLAEHKDTLGAPLCPCRHYDDKEAEVQQGFWNCPCVPMRERKECHCMLFLTSDNDFAGDDQKITLDELKELTANF